MTKKDIVREISKKLDLKQTTTKRVVQMTLDAIIDVLVEDREVQLRNFGVFRVHLRKPRKARNPVTGEAVQVPEKVAVRFKPGKEMARRLRQAYRSAASQRSESRTTSRRKAAE
ncbi:MAG: integration host factor subunit beta [Thermogutta sp.]|nr:integration host factor subunit beta [Thermogutta sp.]